MTLSGSHCVNFNPDGIYRADSDIDIICFSTNKQLVQEANRTLPSFVAYEDYLYNIIYCYAGSILPLINSFHTSKALGATGLLM